MPELLPTNVTHSLSGDVFPAVTDMPLVVPETPERL